MLLRARVVPIPIIIDSVLFMEKGRSQADAPDWGPHILLESPLQETTGSTQTALGRRRLFHWMLEMRSKAFGWQMLGKG